ncbi:hypothetical protein TNCV_3807511 [Trichonephila clavipes]|nr:hypothetical protein TNCV_3807511 [Trichonephila clavipes]
MGVVSKLGKGVAAAQFRPHHLTMVQNARIITKSRGVAEWGGNNIPSRTWQQLKHAFHYSIAFGDGPHHCELWSSDETDT